MIEGLHLRICQKSIALFGQAKTRQNTGTDIRAPYLGRRDFDILQQTYLPKLRPPLHTTTTARHSPNMPSSKGKPTDPEVGLHCGVWCPIIITVSR